MQLLSETHINFIGKRKIAYIFSGAAIFIGIISLVIHGGPKYGIDFTGGVSLQIKFEKKLTPGDIRNSLAKINLGDAEIKSIGMSKDNEFIIRTAQLEDIADIAQTVQNHLSADLDPNYEVRAVTEIGPKIGGELRRAAIMAIFISLIGLLIYI
ncbi:protein translocase subunit SecF, partial [candidate division KSB1 bacterium]|nr:protein translocase subunit SecF [candidate division KSB1 bacterium]